MSQYSIIFTKKAVKDIEKLSPQHKKKLKEILINKIAEDPFCGKKLVGPLDGFFSLRLNYQDRIVYTIDNENKTVYVHRARTHYGD